MVCSDLWPKKSLVVVVGENCKRFLMTRMTSMMMWTSFRLYIPLANKHPNMYCATFMIIAFCVTRLTGCPVISSEYSHKSVDKLLKTICNHGVTTPYL